MKNVAHFYPYSYFWEEKYIYQVEKVLFIFTTEVQIYADEKFGSISSWEILYQKKCCEII